MTTELRDQLQATIGGAYRIDRELGGGGMARVFVAEESALERQVVVKVLPPELAADVNTERFRREVQLAAKLQHPHIVPLLAAGASGGLLYYTMPFIQGESLRAKLSREGELPVSEAIRILRNVADALAYAHERGVVHRDIKPDNILIAGHHAVVTDFGVSKALSNSTGESSLTSMGVALGTPAYMAPEQAAADPNVDHRADLYALGIVGYELLTGEPPFAGRAPQQMLAAQITEAPTPITTKRASVPPALEELIMRCLEKHPADRPQTALEMLRDLEAIATTSGGMALTGAMPAAHSGIVITRVTLARALGSYVGALLVLLLAAKLATEWIGLPDWVLPGALAVMALGLPMIAITALVQRHGRNATPKSATSVSVADGPRGTGRTPDVRLPGRAHPWFTWRRTVLGGAGAVAVFIVVIAVYMLLRSLGIGPAGSLLAAGVLEERERILIADFRGPGSDTLLGSVVTEAFRTDLGQSRRVSVVQPSHIGDVLVRMERPSTTRLDLPLAREVAAREGIKIIVDGDVTPLGSAFLLSARLVSAESGEVLAAFRETARNAEELIPAIDHLSKKLRAKVGESLKVLRAAPPLDRVTTGSLDALRRYTQGVKASDVEGDFQKAVTLLDEAIALDSSFAMAYRKLGIVLGNQGEQPEKRNAALRKAYELRDRLTDDERLMTVGSYFWSGEEFDPQKAIVAYQTLLEIVPAHANALNNLGLVYVYLRDPARAEHYLRRAVEAEDSSSTVSLGNLATVQVELGKVEDAKVTLERRAARFPLNPIAEFDVVALIAAQGDYVTAEQRLRVLRTKYRANPRVVAAGSQQLGLLLLLRGKLADAERIGREAFAAQREYNRARSELAEPIALAMVDIWFRGERARGVRSLDVALARYPLSRIPLLERPYLDLAVAFALADRPDRSRALIAEFDSTVAPVQGRRVEPERRRALGQIALAEGRPLDAVTEFRLSDVGFCELCAPPNIGRAYDLAGNADSAIVAYERYLSTPWLYRSVLDAIFLAGVHKRLGELYDGRGDTGRATSHYARFVELWKDADSELQPKVQAVRRRLEEIRRSERR